MYKKLILASAISLAVVTSSAQATGFPKTDILKIAQQVWESFQRYSEHLIDKAMSETKLDTMASNAEFEIDTWNNGASNAIARINQAVTDIFNLEQSEREVPPPGTCDTLMQSISLDDALCNTASALEDINASHRAVYAQANQAVAGQSLNSINLAASDQDRQKITREALANYEIELKKHLENLDRHVAEGRAEDVYRADLMDMSDAAPWGFTEDQYDIAKSRFFLEHPAFLEVLHDDEINPMQRALLDQKRILWDTATQVTAKHIALKTRGENDAPSRYEVLQLASKLRLVEGMPDPGDHDNKSFLQDIAVNNSGEGANKREEMIMASLKLDQALNRYKQTLALEQQINNLAIIKYHELKKQ